MAGERKGKKKGLGGLSPEKKKLLKQLIMQKAAEDLKAQQERDAEEKKKIISTRIPKLEIDGLSDDQLQQQVKKLHNHVAQLEEEKYDWEVKLRKQDYEINELTIKVNDIKGKFVKPVLKKVSKTETKMAKFDRAEKTKSISGFREQLKSTGQSKFALEEEDTGAKKPDWGQDQLKHKEGEEGGEEEEGGEAAEEEEEEEEEEE